MLINHLFTLLTIVVDAITHSASDEVWEGIGDIHDHRNFPIVY